MFVHQHPPKWLCLSSQFCSPPTHTHSLFPLFPRNTALPFFSPFSKNIQYFCQVSCLVTHTLSISIPLFPYSVPPPLHSGYLSIADFSSLFNSFNIFPPALAPSCLQNSEALSINKIPPLQSEKGLKVLGHSF